MTYCVAMSLDAGMVFASDSRTNAGVDQIARFSKMRIFTRDGDRVIVTLSSGNLSITQNALSIVDQRARKTDGELNLWNATSMFDVARLTGDALREVKTRDGPYLLQNNIDSHANFIVGGQVKGEAPRSEEHTSELQSPLNISYAVFCLKKKKKITEPAARGLVVSQRFGADVVARLYGPGPVQPLCHSRYFFFF